MKIIPLLEGVFTIDKSKKMIPFNLDKDVLDDRVKGSLLVGITPFLVITSNDIILLDTGLNFEQKAVPAILDTLQKNHIDATDITKVLLSHLHTDHVGGLTTKDAMGNEQLTFPYATYYVQEQELLHALSSNSPSYKSERLKILQNHSQVTLLHGDGKIGEHIHYSLTGAHALYHQVFWIEEDGEWVFFGADDAPQLAQMKTKFAAKYDYDGKKAMNLREQWWQTGNANQWTFLFYHDIKTAVYSCLNI